VLPFLNRNPLKELFTLVLGLLFGWQKDHADAILAHRRKRDIQRCRFMGQKTLRYLEQNSRSITGVCFAATGASVIQIQENLDRLLNNFV
jgi:hypothetical protein